MISRLVAALVVTAVFGVTAVHAWRSASQLPGLAGSSTPRPTQGLDQRYLTDVQPLLKRNSV